MFVYIFQCISILYQTHEIQRLNCTNNRNIIIWGYGDSRVHGYNKGKMGFGHFIKSLFSLGNTNALKKAV